MSKSFHAWFTQFAKFTADKAGHPLVFGVAAAAVVIWAATGPLFGFDNTWQLVINTSTTIITFLMVFLIQNTQNRDSLAVQIKLDELIRALDGANKLLLDLEELGDQDLQRIRSSYEELAKRARQVLGQTKGDPAIPPDLQAQAPAE